MRIPGQMLGKQTHLLNDLFHLADTIRFVFIQMEVVQTLGDDLIHGGPLVQGSGGILEHHLDVSDDLPVQSLGDLAGDAHAFIVDSALCTGVGPDHSPANSGLTGAGFPYKGEGLPFVNIKGHIFGCPNQVVALTEVDIHMLDGKEDLLAVFGNGTVLGEAMRMSFFLVFVSHSGSSFIC